MEIRRAVFALLLLVAGIASAVGGWLLARSPHETSSAAEVLAQLELPNLDGERSGPADLRGRVVVLDFWASWCSPCHVQSRILGELVDEYAQRGVAFFAVNVGESEEVVRSSLEEHPIAFPVLLDVDGDQSASAEVHGLPTLIVLDADGEIAMRRVGLTSERMIRGQLDELLGEGPSGEVAERTSAGQGSVGVAGSLG